MIVMLLIMITLLFILSLVFEIRELYYLAKFQRPDTDQEGCLYKSLDSDSNGLVSANCRNKFYSKKFNKNGKRCPIRCLGQTYKDCNNNFETMTRTDRYYMTKKLLCMLSTILGMIITVLNIMDKLS